MSGFRRSSRAHSIFVGNIPYGATEEELTQIFSEVGQVVSFRIVYDRETGKPVEIELDRCGCEWDAVPASTDGMKRWRWVAPFLRRPHPHSLHCPRAHILFCHRQAAWIRILRVPR